MATPRGLTPLEAANEIRNANNGQVVLVLQGGGALGAYQGGVYQALHDAGIEPDWLIGTSIGAINASIIAGNKVEDRLTNLQEFWRRVQRSSLWGAFPAWRGVADALASWTTLTTGIPGFFETNPSAFLGAHVPLGVRCGARAGGDHVRLPGALPPRPPLRGNRAGLGGDRTPPPGVFRRGPRGCEERARRRNSLRSRLGFPPERLPGLRSKDRDP